MKLVDEIKELIEASGAPMSGKGIRKVIKLGKVEWPVMISPDIAANGGPEGKGTTVHVWIDKDGESKIKGFQGPATDKTLNAFLKKLTKKGLTPSLTVLKDFK